MSKASALREQAIAAFKAADDLVVDEGGPAAENQEQFDAHMASGRDLMDQYRKQAEREGTVLSLRETLGDIAGAVRGQGPVPFTQVTVPAAGRSLGEAFVASDEYHSLVASGALQSDMAAFKSKPFQAAATDVIQSTPSTGPGSALVTPQYLPGILPLPQRPLTVRDLFGSGTTSSDSISYAAQTAFDNAAATVAQATAANNGAKPQSSVAWQRRTSAVETLATWMAVTRQQLADAGQVRSLIDNQLRLMLALEEEDQLLNGDGTSPNLSGIYDQSGVQDLDLGGLGGVGNLDGIRTARRLVRTGLSRLTADAIVLNPVDSENFDLLKDLEGRYRGGNPIGSFTFDQPIWALRRVESEAMQQGKALVGAFKAGATVLERQGITILVAEQHSDFFVRNLVVILAEERLGFPVFFPSAFVDVNLDDDFIAGS